MSNHEHPPRGDEPTPDHELGPDRERLEPWEIDLTGAVTQDDSQRDVINDAILEAQGSGGEVPEWGARTIARFLANQIGGHNSHLHQFAATGHAEPDQISRELAELYNAASTSAEERSWINWLGTYLINRPATPTATEHELADPATSDVPITGSALEKVTHYLQHAFTEADARGEAITADDARAIATLLAPLLGSATEMGRFAETGEADHHDLLLECQVLKGRRYATTEIPDSWIPRLEQHLARNPPLPRSDLAGPDGHELTGTAAEGVRDHGDAFRAYLSLADIDPSREDLTESFHEFYVGNFASMDQLLDELTEVTAWEGAIAELAGKWGIDELVSLDRDKVQRIARDTWDIVEIQGRLYAFTK